MFKNISNSTKCSVFLFPHQDDEFGIFQVLSNEVRKGCDVRCIYLTDGGFKADKRNKESLNVLKKIGVKSEQVLFQGQLLEINDGELVYNLNKATKWLLLYLKSLGDIDFIYVPSWEGGHPDHDALHALTVFAANILGLVDNVRQFSLYNGFKCRASFYRVMSPLEENGQIEYHIIPILERIKFIRMCLGYPSQALTWLGLFPFAFYKYLFKGRQCLQKVSLERLCIRPHKGRLYYESRGFETWNKMQSKVNELLNTSSDQLIFKER